MSDQMLWLLKVSWLNKSFKIISLGSVGRELTTSAKTSHARILARAISTHLEIHKYYVRLGALLVKGYLVELVF